MGNGVIAPPFVTSILGGRDIEGINVGKVENEEEGRHRGLILVFI
jgi:hypothetical protein